MEDGGHGDLISNIESLNKQRHIYKMAGIMMHKLHKFFSSPNSRFPPENVAQRR